MRPRIRFTVFVVAGLAVAAALAFFVSPAASGEPDGLNKVAIDEGFADRETDHAFADAPTAGYAVEGVEDERLSTGLAGLIGVTATFALAGGLMLAVRHTGGGDPGGRHTGGRDTGGRHTGGPQARGAADPPAAPG